MNNGANATIGTTTAVVGGLGAALMVAVIAARAARNEADLRAAVRTLTDVAEQSATQLNSSTATMRAAQQTIRGLEAELEDALAEVRELKARR